MSKKNYIIVCDDEVQNEKVQIKILGAGYLWSEGSGITQYKNKPVLIFDNLNNKERSISYHNHLMTNEYKIHSCYQKHLIIHANDFLLMKKF